MNDPEFLSMYLDKLSEKIHNSIEIISFNDEYTYDEEIDRLSKYMQEFIDTSIKFKQVVLHRHQKEHDNGN